MTEYRIMEKGIIIINPVLVSAESGAPTTPTDTENKIRINSES